MCIPLQPQLPSAGQQGLRDGDPDGSTHVAHQVEQAGGIADLLIAQRAISGGRDWHEDKGEAEPCDQDGQQKRRRRDIQRDVAEVKRGQAEGEEAEGQQLAGVDLVGEKTDTGIPQIAPRPRGATTSPAVKAV